MDVKLEFLRSLLEYPPDQPDRRERWIRLTTGSTLHDSLRAVVRSGVMPAWEDGLSSMIAKWKDFARGEGFEEQWKQAKRLAWCACEAAALWKMGLDGVDRIEIVERIGEIVNPPADHEIHEVLTDLFRGWIVEFRLAPAARKCVDVPVALYDLGANCGLVATLSLTLIDANANTVFPDPAQAFTTRLDEQFLASMCRAWSLAKNQARCIEHSAAVGPK